MAKIFAITNQKGGVGKTTTTVNLAASLAATKRKILLIDFDPQGNATMGCGIDKYACEQTVYDLLTSDIRPEAVIQYSESGDFDVLPANADLTAAEVQLLEVHDKERVLQRKLSLVSANYDYILIDCPPSLNMLTLNALAAAQAVIVPIQCEYYALEGLSALLNTVAKVAEAVNPALRIEGLLRTMYDGRNSLTNDVSNQLIEHFGERVYRTVIPRNVRLAEAPSHGEPIIAYDRSSKGAIAYLALAGELLRREEGASAAVAEADNLVNKNSASTAAENKQHTEVESVV